MCIDYRYLNKEIPLNKESPKDDFPLPYINILVDNTTNHALFSFMDGYVSYNLVKMAKKDMKKAIFINP